MYENLADQFVAAVMDLTADPEKLYNMGSYLAHHFPEWLQKYASTPAGLVSELRLFADM